jgi:hypothetical protein
VFRVEIDGEMEGIVKMRMVEGTGRGVRVKPFMAFFVPLCSSGPLSAVSQAGIKNRQR